MNWCDLDCFSSIAHSRLRAWIDQPLHLLYFESRSPDTDADAQGTAGGLGIEREEKPVEPVTWTERWDDRIRETSIKVNLPATRVTLLMTRWKASLLLFKPRSHEKIDHRVLRGWNYDHDKNISRVTLISMHLDMVISSRYSSDFIVH